MASLIVCAIYDGVLNANKFSLSDSNQDRNFKESMQLYHIMLASYSQKL